MSSREVIVGHNAVTSQEKKKLGFGFLTNALHRQLCAQRSMRRKNYLQEEGNLFNLEKATVYFRAALVADSYLIKFYYARKYN